MQGERSLVHLACMLTSVLAGCSAAPTTAAQTPAICTRTDQPSPPATHMCGAQQQEQVQERERPACAHVHALALCRRHHLTCLGPGTLHQTALLRQVGFIYVVV